MIEIPKANIGEKADSGSLLRAFLTFVESVRAAVNPVIRKPIIDGRILSSVTFSAASTYYAVAHGLGRKPQGWVVVSVNDSSASISEDPTLRTDKFLYLMISGGGYPPVPSFDIWVF